MNLSLVSIGKMKRLVNASKNFVLLMIKATYNGEFESFTRSDSKMKHEFFEAFNTYDKMFQEPEGFPPKRGIHHDIHLQLDALLQNIGMHRM